MRLIPLVFSASLLVLADEKGVPPRAHSSDYEAHQESKTATLAVSRVPARTVERMFSAEIARGYVVLEVAVCPKDGENVDVDWFDFGLKIGETVVHVEKPHDVVVPWPEKTSVPPRGPTVIAETGGIYQRTNDPVNGKRSGVGTYEGVTVTTEPGAAAPPPPPPTRGPDPQVVEQRIREKMLPQGQTRAAVAGYLFFPQYNVKKHKGDRTELQWTQGDTTTVVRLLEK